MLHLTLVRRAGDFPQLLLSCVTASGESIYSHPKREVKTQKRNGYIQFQFSDSMGLLGLLTGKRIEYMPLKETALPKGPSPACLMTYKDGTPASVTFPLKFTLASPQTTC